MTPRRPHRVSLRRLAGVEPARGPLPSRELAPAHAGDFGWARRCDHPCLWPALRDSLLR